MSRHKIRQSVSWFFLIFATFEFFFSSVVAFFSLPHSFVSSYEPFKVRDLSVIFRIYLYFVLYLHESSNLSLNSGYRFWTANLGLFFPKKVKRYCRISTICNFLNWGYFSHLQIAISKSAVHSCQFNLCKATWLRPEFPPAAILRRIPNRVFLFTMYIWKVALNL